MTDISGVPAFGGGGHATWQPPETQGQAVPEVAKSATDGSATSTKGDTLAGQNGQYTKPNQTEASAPSRDAPNDAGIYDRRQAHDDSVLTGPTPAFQASVLEVESDLRNVIAKVEAKRTQQADEAAIAPNASVGSAADDVSDTAAASQRDVGEVQRPTEARAAETAAGSAKHDAAPASAEPRPEPDVPSTSEPKPAPVPAQAVDPETVHAGPAAQSSTPYDPVN